MYRTGERHPIEIGVRQGNVAVRTDSLKRLYAAVFRPSENDELRVGDDDARAALHEGVFLADANEHERSRKTGCEFASKVSKIRAVTHGRCRRAQ